MLTDILFQKEARNKMKLGASKISDAVVATMGARGRNVAIRDPATGKPKFTKDGVTVARTINLTDKFEDMGAQVVKEAAEKTAVMAGDGTTTATLLAHTMIQEGLHHVDSAGVNPVEVKEGIDMAVKKVVAYIDVIKKSIEPNSKELIAVGTISANNDHEIGAQVANAVSRVGKDGYVAIQEGRTTETTFSLTEGLQIDKGYKSHLFVNNLNKMTVEFHKEAGKGAPLILMVNAKVSILKDVQHILEYAIKNQRALLLIAEDIDGEVLMTMIANRTQAGRPFAAITLPGMGNMQAQILQDIAVMTGGKVVSPQEGTALSGVNPADVLGTADSITISKYQTILCGTGGKKADIDAHIESLRSLIEHTDNVFEREKLQKQRLAKLANGVGILTVGAQTEMEIKQKKDRVEDAVCACTVALQDGIVPGGGVIYLHAMQTLKERPEMTTSQAIGWGIVEKSLEKPFTQMMENGGQEIYPATISNLLQHGSIWHGIDMKKGEQCDLYEAGIIDPTKVAKCALENAASVAGMLLTTECAIVDATP